MKKLTVSALLFVLISCTSNVNSTQKISRKDSEELCKIITNEIYHDLKQQAEIKIKHLKISQNYAWLEGIAKRKDGKEFVFPDESYDCCHVEGLFKKQNNKWLEIEIAWFSTDCWYCGLSKRHPEIPKEIFNKAQL